MAVTSTMRDLGATLARLWTSIGAEEVIDGAEGTQTIVLPGADDRTYSYGVTTAGAGRVDPDLEDAENNWVGRRLPCARFETREDAQEYLARVVRRFFVRRGGLMQGMRKLSSIARRATELGPSSPSESTELLRKEEMITQLLLETDGVHSHNNPILRQRRKEVVEALHEI